MKIVMLERDSIGKDIDLSCFGKLGDLTQYPVSVLEDTPEKIKDADIIIMSKVPMNEQTLKDAVNVKLICVTATGVDNIDLAYTNSRGIVVTNVKDYSTAAVAQHTFALAFYLLEKLNYYDNYVKSGKYAAQPTFSNFDLPFSELDGKTWGIVGMGNIGRKVAKIAEAYGCNVIFYSASGNNNSTEYKRVDLDVLLKESDILSLHCPLTDRTKNLMNWETLIKMKQSAILINVARGPVVNDADLCKALTENIIAGAGLDVLSREPIQKDNPLGSIKDSTKLIITPHLAWASIEARTRLAEEVFQNAAAFINGEARNVVK